MPIWKKLCCCCPEKGEEENGDIIHLDYNHGSLTEVPTEVFTNERTLEKLDLSFNSIVDLHPSLFHCHELKELYLNDNHLEEIPTAIESLVRLQKLCLQGNGTITDLPRSMRTCRNLTYLDLCGNNFTRCPEVVCHLVNLEELYLTDIDADFLPANIGRLTKLRTLEVRTNTMSSLPVAMQRLTSLQRLDIGNNEFSELPDVIGSLTNLTELYADTNTIAVLPQCIGNLTKLTCLDLSKNCLDDLPNEIGKLSNVMDLTLSCNKLLELPRTFVKMDSLTTIRLTENKLTILPEEFGSLKNLQELDLSCNSLQVLPTSIGLLRKLHTVYLDANDLGEIPKEIGSCAALTVLSLSHNRLMRVPSELGSLKNLRMLNLINNRLQNLPVSIMGLVNLGSLWLTERQNKPKVALNKDLDSSTGQYVATCFLLPQLPIGDVNENAVDDIRPRRSQKRIRFKSDNEEADDERPFQNGELCRTPTPYPKELRQMAKYVTEKRAKGQNNGGVVQHCSSSQAQNEPVYEGDLQNSEQDVKDGTVEGYDGGRAHTESYNLPKDVIEKTALLELNYDPEPTTTTRYLSEDLNRTITIPSPMSSPPAGRTPPPYHIAAKRAAYLRSSGGAGSGKLLGMDLGLPTPPVDSMQNRVNAVPGAQTVPSLPQQPPPEIPSYQEDLIIDDNISVSMNEMEPNLNRTYNVEEFKEVFSVADNNGNNIGENNYAEIDVSSSTGLDLNQTITITDYVNANFDQVTDSETSLGGMELPPVMPPPPERNPRGSFRESRIPTSNSKGEGDANRNEGSSSQRNLQEAQGRGVSPPKKKIPQQSFIKPPSSMQIPNQQKHYSNASDSALTKLQEMKPLSASTPKQNKFKSASAIGGSVSMTTVQKHSSEDKSRIPKIGGGAPSRNPSGGRVSLDNKNLQSGGGSAEEPQKSALAPSMRFVYTNQVSPGHHPHGTSSAKSISRSGIPIKPVPSKEKEDEEKDPQQQPPTIAAYETGQIGYVGASSVSLGGAQSAQVGKPKSGIPKLSFSSSAITRSGGGELPSPDPRMSSRKPWIFGSHKNARVESVEYRKVDPDTLGFTVEEFTGQSDSPRGIFVVATESEDLPIKVGDKILQVDGIGVDNMNSAIVNKILANCSENITLLISRHY